MLWICRPFPLGQTATASQAMRLSGQISSAIQRRQRKLRRRAKAERARQRSLRRAEREAAREDQAKRLAARDEAAAGPPPALPFCNLCQRYFGSEDQLARHASSDLHAANLRQQRQTSGTEWRTDPASAPTGVHAPSQPVHTITIAFCRCKWPPLCAATFRRPRRYATGHGWRLHLLRICGILWRHRGVGCSGNQAGRGGTAWDI